MRNDAGRTADNRLALAGLGRRSKDEERAGASLSGHERDHLFLSAGGAEFADVSGVSGLDDPADGRAFGILDYDRDGWPDIALVNSNAPMLELFRNQIGDPPAGGSAAPDRGRMIAVRLVGGNDTPEASRAWSSRDGYGARVTVGLGERTLVRELRAGEGFAAQNSAVLIVGIGDRESAPSVSVRWPAGSTQATTEIPAGTLLTVYENPAQAPGGEAFARAPYVPERSAARPEAAPPSAPAAAPVAAPTPARLGAAPVGRARKPFPLPAPAGEAARARLRLYTTMATWCLPCRGELPRFRLLRDAFPPADLALFGVPIDTGEGRDLLDAWEKSNRPAYALLKGLEAQRVAGVKGLVVGALDFDAVPASIVTDASGNVLHAQWGPPTVSRLRELLRRQEQEKRTSAAR